MVRWMVAAACVVMALAGCSSPPQESMAGSPSPSPSLTTIIVGLPVAPTSTDTLHLLDAPHMAAAAPTGSDPIRSPVPVDYSPLAKPLEWTMARPGLRTITAHVHLWVDVEGSVVNTHSDGCFWDVYLKVGTTDSGALEFACANEPQVVPTGIRAIDVDVTFDVSKIVGDQFALGLESAAASAPGASVTALGGTPQYDSTMRIEGLSLPLDTTTLL